MMVGSVHTFDPVVVVLPIRLDLPTVEQICSVCDRYPGPAPVVLAGPGWRAQAPATVDPTSAGLFSDLADLLYGTA